MALIFLPKDRKQDQRHEAVDWWGIGFLVVAVGSLQTFLEEGEKNDWFQSGEIVTLAIASLVGLGLFIWRELDLSLYDAATNERLNQLTGALQSRGSDPATAHQQAIAVLEQTVNLQAAVLSFADIFRVVGIAFLCSLPLLLFLGKGKAGSAPSVH